MGNWSPDQYLKFADERTRAARDFLAQVPLKEAKVVYDPGCGTNNRREPSHETMEAATQNTPYATKLRGVALGAMPPPVDYFSALKPHCARLDIWHVIYNHPLKGSAAIMEWVKGTGLRPFLARLTPAEQGGNLARYEALLAKSYPVMADGMALLRFPCLFFVATK